MKNLKKKGFTIVELVIVIAVIAILSAVLIPTFSNLIRKANVSADTQLVKQLNQALAVEEVENGKNATMHDALETVKEYGFDIAKINAKANLNEILWDSKNNIFVYFDADADKIVYIPNAEPDDKGEGAELWKIYNDEDELTEQTYSIYWNKAEAFIGDLTVGFDAGTTEGNQITYKGENNVTLRTNGGKVTVDAPQATVNHYGLADEVYVEKVSANTYNLFGDVAYMEVAAGQHVVLAEGSSVNGVFVNDADKSNVEIKNGQTSAVKSNTEVSREQLLDSATKFAGGLGTQAEPYLIKSVEHMENISTKYDSYNYYKVVDGVEVLDLSEYTPSNLNGSFDGNGVSFINVKSFIFITVGSCNPEDVELIKIANFNVKFDGGEGVVRQCGAKNLEFNCVNASGYLLTGWNSAIFLRYGTQNVHETGFDYTVSFKECSSNAEIYSKNNPYCSILVGHPYPGTGNTLTLNVDASTDEAVESTILYYTGNDKEGFGYKYASAGSLVIYVDGNEVTNDKVYTNVVKVDSTKCPEKNENGSYDIIAQGDTAKVVVSLLWQYTLYTENYEEQIPSQSGVGGQIGENIVITIEDNKNLTVFEAFESVEIVTGADKWDYEIKEGKLIIYMTTDNEFVDGNLSLVTEQFTSSSNIAKYKGSLVIASKEKANWVK